jgi:ABC-type cobalamin/Fe3+-siderophores transport system ATPase subunit
MAELLSLTEVCVEQVLADVSLSVSRGEIVAVAGLGRTTLLQVAGGRVPPARGEVRLCERDVVKLSEYKRERLYARQAWWVDRDQPQGPFPKVDDQVALPLLARGLSLREARGLARAALERVDASYCASRQMGSLSSSEQLLVGLACGFAVSPQIMLIDDLFDGLGIRHAQNVGRLLRSLVDELSCGALLGISDIGSAFFADRLFHLSQGRLKPLPDNHAYPNVSPMPRAMASEVSLDPRHKPAVWARGVLSSGHARPMADVVNELLATEAALDKLGARGISVAEAKQAIWNRHLIVKNRRGRQERPQPSVRRLLIGCTDANRILTLVIEETVEPSTWLLVTGWDSSPAERRILEQS